MTDPKAPFDLLFDKADEHHDSDMWDALIKLEDNFDSLTQPVDDVPQVQRWDMLDQPCEMHPNPEGDYVEYADYARLACQRQAAEETNRRLNRRCQEAESAARDTVEAAKRSGGSFGRTLARFAANDAIRRAEAAEAQVSRLREALVRWRAFEPFERVFNHSGAMNATQLGERDLYMKLCDAVDAALAETKEPT